ncbi:ribonuclease H1-like isoform X2 [Hyla sarda]|uniref:ribonuclease H1-like isoform X2 n=1 Tax=Hyla sarda TaxID=327740 RepID=UPI0024C2A95C|nr:ribonuclease H1-like isoform X2 [Hyla sarda]
MAVTTQHRMDLKFSEVRSSSFQKEEILGNDPGFKQPDNISTSEQGLCVSPKGVSFTLPTPVTCPRGQGNNYSSYSNYGDQGKSHNVFTDGCCVRNGKSGAKGGVGVYWGPGNPLNVSERLEGRPTNQRAEIEAARRAVEQARENNYGSVTIHTDSKYTIKGMTEWMPKWKENGFKTYSGGDVVHKAEFQNLDSLCQGLDVTWRHVPGHSGNPGNEMADQLARSGARK